MAKTRIAKRAPARRADTRNPKPGKQPRKKPVTQPRTQPGSPPAAGQSKQARTGPPSYVLTDTGTGKRPPRPRPLPLPHPGPDDPHDYGPEIDIITVDIQQRLSSADKAMVTSRADVGRKLIEVKTMLPHGHWLPWLKENISLTAPSAERAMNLHRFRDKDPDRFEEIAPLGLTKAYVAINLPTEKLDVLLAGAHFVHSTGALKTAVQMTVAELIAHLAGPAGDTPKPKLVSVLRRHVRAVVTTLDAILDNLPVAAPLPAAERTPLTKLHDDLTGAVTRLGTALHR